MTLYHIVMRLSSGDHDWEWSVVKEETVSGTETVVADGRALSVMAAYEAALDFQRGTERDTSE